MKTTYGQLNKILETVWLMSNTTCPSLSYRTSSTLIAEAKTIYETRLRTLPPPYMEYNLLLKKGYMKEKHWIYAIVMAAAESLPLLYRTCTPEQIQRSVMAKASLGASSKLLDNLNDEIHTVEEALDSLENYLSALKTGTFREKCASSVEQAESTSCEMASWVYHYLNKDAEAFSLYKADCTKLVNGQIASLRHKGNRWPSLADYVASIAEKSIGDVWIDIDLCQVDALDQSLIYLKKANEYIFKSSLVYDDVQDIYEDLHTRSVNSAVILGMEKGIISTDDLEEMDTSALVHLLEEQDVLKEIIYLADALFLKGVDILVQVDNSLVDMKGLLRSFRLVRLFNLRKLLLMNKDLWTFKQFLASFSDFSCLRDQIPTQISQLVN